MFSHNEQNHQLDLTFDTTELNASQVRLLKSVNAFLLELLTTKSEHHYFEKSNEVMKLVALAIKEANFAREGEKKIDIPYGDQAIELAVDDLVETLHSRGPSRFSFLDN